MLIHVMGDQAEEIFTSFGLNEDDSSNYNTVQERFAKHFVKQRNPMYERAHFNQRVEQPGETVDLFVMALYTH